MVRRLGEGAVRPLDGISDTKALFGKLGCIAKRVETVVCSKMMRASSWLDLYRGTRLCAQLQGFATQGSGTTDRQRAQTAQTIKAQ